MSPPLGPKLSNAFPTPCSLRTGSFFGQKRENKEGEKMGGGEGKRKFLSLSPPFFPCFILPFHPKKWAGSQATPHGPGKAKPRTLSWLALKLKQKGMWSNHGFNQLLKKCKTKMGKSSSTEHQIPTYAPLPLKSDKLLNSSNGPPSSKVYGPTPPTPIPH